MKCAILSPGDQRWPALLERCSHEFYHWPGYLELEARRIGGQAAALWVGDQGGEWLLPVVIRSVDRISGIRVPASQWRDAVTPYGYPHPLWYASENSEDAFLGAALSSLQAYLRRVGVVAVFARCSPLRSLPGVFRVHGHVVDHGPCFWFDLSETAEDLQSQLRKGYRYDVNVAKRSGLEAKFTCFQNRLSAFTDLYYRTMGRVGAASWYYFERPYFEQLGGLLGESLRLCEVLTHGGVAAAGLFAVSGGVVQYLFSAVDDRVKQPNATKLMLVFVRDWAKLAGQRFFHLGGGVGSTSDGLSQFKRGFTKHSSTFKTWRWVVDSDRYSELVKAWEEQAGSPAEPVSGYFPAYRSPIPG